MKLLFILPVVWLSAVSLVLAEDRPNIVVVFTDELDHRYIGAFDGYGLTPNIDKLAENGVRFTEAYSVSAACTPSRYSLVTGKFPGRCRGEEFLTESPFDEPYTIAWNTHLEAGDFNVATAFNALGYRTGHSGKWHLGGNWPRIELPELDPEADLYAPETLKILEERQRRIVKHVKADSGFDHVSSVVWMNFDEEPHPGLHHHHMEWILQGGLDFLDSLNAGEPFYLQLTPTGTHGPSHHEDLDADIRMTPGGLFEPNYDYFPPRAEVKQVIQDYHGEVNFWQAGITTMDYVVGGVVKKLKEMGVYENTLIVFVGDHGREPGKTTSYRKGNHVPMIVSWPAQGLKGAVCDKNVQIVDILATCWDAATDGQPLPLQIDSSSFLDAVLGDPFDGREFLYFENGYTRAVQIGSMKYIVMRYPERIVEQIKSGELEMAPDHLGGTWFPHASIAMEWHEGYWDPEQLYDLAADPYEQNNVADDPAMQETRIKLRALLSDVLSTFAHPYDFSNEDFYYSETFRQAAAVREAVGTDKVPWWDPGFQWPPPDGPPQR